MACWNRRKSLESVGSRPTHSALKATLSWPHLVGLGIGGIVGTGIYTLTGVGAGQSRIFFVMARDGLLPERLAAVNSSGSPVLMTMITGIIVAVIAGFLSLQEIAELANAGTLVAFIAVAVCLLVMRHKAPMHPRPFSVPAPWLVAIGAIAGCAYLFVSLPVATICRFLIWNAVGVVVYFLYARHRSLLAKA